jgi:hypothetical protein
LESPVIERHGRHIVDRQRKNLNFYFSKLLIWLTLTLTDLSLALLVASRQKNLTSMILTNYLASFKRARTSSGFDRHWLLRFWFESFQPCSLNIAMRGYHMCRWPLSLVIWCELSPVYQIPGELFFSKGSYQFWQTLQ